MDRREFLTVTGRAADLSTKPFAGLRQINTGLNPYSGAWTTNEVVHLLKRTMFGAKKADIDFFKSLSVSQAVDTLLTVPATDPAPPVKNYDNTSIAATDPDFAVPQGATWVNSTSNDGTANNRRISSLKSWWTGLMINQDRNIREQMVLFWHNHFSTETNEYSKGVFGYRQNLLFRQNAIGNFKQLVRSVSVDLAMLHYLNGYLNTATAPDENYARELQELFTLGKENNPNYTEDDVKTAARVLTGWRINNTTDTVTFDVTKHDKTSKTFSSFYGTVISGRSDATAGDAELDDLMTMIFNKKTEVSEFIIKKIYRWFCYYTIDDATYTNVIKPLGVILQNNNWEIKPVLAALFKSEHFFDPLNQGCLIKSPVDITIGTCREFNIVFPPGSDYVNAYNMWDFIRNQAATMQQNIGDPPNVAGWPAYYQVPNFHELWINADTLPKRDRLTDQLITSGYSRNGQKIIIDPVAFAATLSNPGDPNILINDSLDILFRVPVSDNSKQVIKTQILLSNQVQDYYWSNAWNAYITNPADAT